ncbi:hypothetical protein B0T24DRAFT_316503 [Lasiosphaeria ovina]|uniref:Pentatricopeptide repeat domain-containing protein n=1 Tax=Lasiosphaeria ovina TaxID=92902 RepID=A0AAE0K703_9PEZI|nr:hypothetical protein B0T24DRAFT_316503 [Lasiosphaeria ovina]
MAPRLRACHCPAWHCVTNTVSRQSHGANPPNPWRRRARPGHVSTADYSTATPAPAPTPGGPADAIADADADIAARHKHLETPTVPRLSTRDIEEARLSLAAIMEKTHTGDLAHLVKSADFYSDVFSDPLRVKNVLASICAFRRGSLVGYKANYLQRRERRIWSYNKLCGIPWIRTNPTVRNKKGLVKCEQAIALEVEEGIDHREPKKPIHMQNGQNGVTWLVDRLLDEAYNIDVGPNAPGQVDPRTRLDSAWNQIRMLRSDGYPNYTYPQLDPKQAAFSRSHLNELNGQIVSAWGSRSRVASVAKLCYNLLVCPVPPGIDNYNTLLLSFTRIGEYDLARAVVRFIFSSRLRPTKATTLCLLQYYRLSDDVAGFRDLIRRIIGHHVRGMRLRSNPLRALEHSNFLREWVLNSDVALTKGVLVERAELDHTHFQAIVECLIDFGLLGLAARVFVVYLRGYWAQSPELILDLLNACMFRLDDVAVRILIQGFLENIDEATSMILDSEAFSGEAVNKLRHLLVICQAATLKSRTVSPLRPHSKMSPGGDSLVHLATAIWIRESSNDLDLKNIGLRRIEARITDNVRAPAGQRADLDDVSAGATADGVQRTRPLFPNEIRWPLLIRATWAAGITAQYQGRAGRTLYGTLRVQTMASMFFLNEQYYTLRREIEDTLLQWARLSVEEPDQGPAGVQGGIKLLFRVLEIVILPAVKRDACFAIFGEANRQLKLAFQEALPPEFVPEELTMGPEHVSLKRMLRIIGQYLLSLRIEAGAGAGAGAEAEAEAKAGAEAEAEPEANPFAILEEFLPSDYNGPPPAMTW